MGERYASIQDEGKEKGRRGKMKANVDTTHVKGGVAEGRVSKVVLRRTDVSGGIRC